MAISITKKRGIDYPLSKEQVSHIVDTALAYMQFGYSVGLSIHFTDDRAIKKLNMQQRDIDASTDVLSFPMLSYVFKDGQYLPQIEEGDLDHEDGSVIFGDIVISVETAHRQAEEFGHGIEREVAFLLVHSVLHLLGYDHIDEADKILMRQKEDEIMAHMGIYPFSNEILYKNALSAAQNAYSPYSQIKVGAVALCGSRMYYGCNVENSSYGATVCAERAAICNAISAGERKIDLIAVADATEKGISPCGICRQFMADFGDITVVYKNDKGQIVSVRLSEILPQAFMLKE